MLRRDWSDNVLQHLDYKAIHLFAIDDLSDPVQLPILPSAILAGLFDCLDRLSHVIFIRRP